MMNKEEIVKEIQKLDADLKKGSEMINNLNQQMQQIVLKKQESIGYLRALQEMEGKPKVESKPKNEKK